MGQTKRFLEKMYDENDALNEAHALLRQKCEELYCDDVEKNQQLKKMINEMVSQADDLYKKVWREFEPQVKNEDSELLEALGSVLNLTLLSECQKWVNTK
jgi:vacuolar-type H+-ATPase subunit D/Vma8